MVKLSEADRYESALCDYMLTLLEVRMKREGISQTELSERVGSRISMVNRVFRRRQKIVSVQRLDYWALALGYKWEVRLVKRHVK